MDQQLKKKSTALAAITAVIGGATLIAAIVQAAGVAGGQRPALYYYFPYLGLLSTLGAAVNSLIGGTLIVGAALLQSGDPRGARLVRRTAAATAWWALLTSTSVLVVLLTSPAWVQLDPVAKGSLLGGVIGAGLATTIIFGLLWRGARAFLRPRAEEQKAGGSESRLAEDLGALARLHENGALSDEEFNIAKARLLRG